MAPRLSIGVPLYKAAPFVDVIVRNIDNLDLDDFEVMFADRHLHDDAIDRLEAMYGTDERFQFIRHTDAKGWIDNYNSLLERASGTYFTWLPQDDGAPRPMSTLLEQLDRDPSAILAYPRIEMVDSQGTPLPKLGRPDRTYVQAKNRSWSFKNAWAVAARLRHPAAVKGVFRLAPVNAEGLRIQSVRGGLLALDAFRYGLALRGRFITVPSAVCEYRVHAGNFTARHPRAAGRYVSYYRAARSYQITGHGPLSGFLRDLGLFTAAMVVAPSARAAWKLTPRGRKGRTVVAAAGPEEVTRSCGPGRPPGSPAP